MSKTRRLCLYLHTHWDREWYLTFEEYRTQLTLVVDEILKELEAGTLPSFMLDGQSCVLEDLQEVDSSLTDRIAKLMAVGKIEAGPWYVLADQLLVSGESLMRNLEMGLAVTRRFGQPSMIGYCPDTFGHSQDLPRILQSYGIATAIVWRGVPDMAGKTLFWWTSSDGSKVLTYHLSRGYYQTAFFEDRTAENLAEHLLSWRNTSKAPSKVNGFDAVLVPVGGDHLSAPRGFTKQLQSARLLSKMESLAMAAEGRESKAVESAANLTADPLLHPDLQASNVVAFPSQTEDSCLIEANSLRRFVELMQRHAGGRGSKIPSIHSELRDNASALKYERAYMLQGVLSTRLYLKRENRLSERRIARVLEPAFALLHCEKLVDYPAAQLNYAWRLLLQNHPHDSICGCSVDYVHREMMQRTEKFHQVLNVLERRASETLFSLLADESADGSLPSTPFRAALRNPLLLDPTCHDASMVLFNLSGSKSMAPVFIEWCDEYNEEDTRSFCARPVWQKTQSELSMQVVDQSLETIVFTGTNQIPETRKVIVNKAWIAPTTAVPSFGYKRISVDSAFFDGAEVLPQGVSEDLSGSISRGAFNDVSVNFLRESARIDDHSGQLSIINGQLAVSVDFAGVLKVTAFGADFEQAGQNKDYLLAHKIKDAGDAGDTYNFDPIDGDSYLQAKFVEAKPGQNGPLVASIILKYELDIPERLEINLPQASGGKSTSDGADNGATQELRSEKSRSSNKISHVFTTEIELRKSVPILFFETRWENLSRDHRLEVFIETGSPVKCVFSENHFSMIERECTPVAVSLPVEKGTESPLDRFPCQRFFIANQQAFFNAGLPEFGVEGSAVSMTILRAVSALSRADLRSRGGGAGPPLETPEANCLGWNKVNYGWAPLLSTIDEQSGLTPVESVDDSMPEVMSDILQDATAAAPQDAMQSLQIALAYQLCEQFENLSWGHFRYYYLVI